MESVIQKLENKWNRSICAYVDHIHSMYSQEALTGWVLILDGPRIVEFKSEKCLGIDLSTWIMLKTLGSETVTPFRIVAKGKGLIEKAFMPHTGLKYAVRNIEGVPVVHIPISDFQSV